MGNKNVRRVVITLPLTLTLTLTKVGDKNVRRVVKLTRNDNFTVAHKFERRRYRATHP